jgi:DNA-binding CsgD family transcriptional regulator
MVTDPRVDPDRRAWHRANAAAGPDVRVAHELERSASRAQARGGLAAAAAFLERAAVLTPEPGQRAQRLLAAARAKRDAGALGAALALLIAVEAGPPDALRMAETEHLRGQIALDDRRGTDAARLLMSAAKRLEPLNPALARETHLEALGAAMWAGDLQSPSGPLVAAQAASAAPIGPEPPRAVDDLLDAFVSRFTDGYEAAAPLMTRALERFLAEVVRTDDVGRWLWLSGSRASAVVALELWDAESWHSLATRQAQVARDTGALVQLQFALNFLARTHLLAGELNAAALLLEEDRLIAAATGNPPVAYSDIALAAWRGREAQAIELIEASLRAAHARGVGRMVNAALYARSVLYNGLGRYDIARDAARRAFECDQLGYGPVVVPELAEAASRTGDTALVRAALDWVTERACVVPAAWALGIETRVRAMLSRGDTAEGLYLESIAHLSSVRLRAELARAHLLYGEWLRRERRRLDARQELQTAHDMLKAMGIEAFAERARRELLATGKTARRRTDETTAALTVQEAQVARMARDGLSNPEIGARLFLSPRTVQYHLRKAFAKLQINTRSQLDLALPDDPNNPRRQ